MAKRGAFARAAGTRLAIGGAKGRIKKAAKKGKVKKGFLQALEGGVRAAAASQGSEYLGPSFSATKNKKRKGVKRVKSLRKLRKR